ncbi:MAG: Coenzyme F420 hydrogenase/dehydrogenase, beta subunit C-terminal domain [Lachnospiraceae bacterium]|nr:Coenzyme F420 hydrogenase/dehydrogenase, beta subunit C-terminal domain [Lachnospiraceae bacterium]
MIKIIDKKKCSGCTACASVCPKDCISMKVDNEGFLYPEVDTTLCIACNACDSVCPVKNHITEHPVEQKGFLIQHIDDTIRKDSAAGGAFTAIASAIIKKGGVVFGAAYDENFQVRHTYVEQIEELYIFRNSKYVQSRMENCFRLVKDFLLKGRWVCFSGTPCQVEGLYKYLGKDYPNLILIDVVCHGIPSPLIWKCYLEYMQVSSENTDNIRFRDKYYGYKYSTMSIIQNGKNVYHAGSHQDPMLRAFFSDICNRPICYECPFKKRYRVSDITVWDCFSVYDFDDKLDDDKGTTRVLCHTNKGVSLIEMVKSEVKYIEVSASKLVYGVKEMYESVRINPKREQFFRDAINTDAVTLFNSYYPITLKVRFVSLVRFLLLKIGIYKYVKRILNKINGR